MLIIVLFSFAPGINSYLVCIRILTTASRISLRISPCLSTSSSNETRLYDYPIAMLQALRDSKVGANRPPDRPFRFLYWSGQSADPTEKSMQMWARVKVCSPINIDLGMLTHVVIH